MFIHTVALARNPDPYQGLTPAQKEQAHARYLNLVEQLAQHREQLIANKPIPPACTEVPNPCCDQCYQPLLLPNLL